MRFKPISGILSLFDEYPIMKKYQNRKIAPTSQ
jgi:hypothetical protein